MFTDKEISAYRNIKAPDSLRQKIISEKSSRKNLKIITGCIATVAACFVIILSSVIISQNSKIIVNGQQLHNSVEISCLSRTVERGTSFSISVPIQLKVKQPTKISVPDGTISINGGKQSKEITITSAKEILWEIAFEEAQGEFEMFITDNKGVQKVTLKYDNTKITVIKEKEK